MADAEAGRRQRREARRADGRAAHVAGAVLPTVEASDGVVHVPQFPVQLSEEDPVPFPVLQLGRGIGRVALRCGPTTDRRLEIVEPVTAHGPAEDDQSSVLDHERSPERPHAVPSLVGCADLCHDPVLPGRDLRPTSPVPARTRVHTGCPCGPGSDGRPARPGVTARP